MSRRAAIGIWQFRLDLRGDALGGLWELLDPWERARAFAFAAERDLGRFVAARGQLRLLLGAVAGEAPGSLVFVRDSRGKPRLLGRGAPRFNLSHCGDHMVVAVARDVASDFAVGIDIENRNRCVSPRAASRAFAASELRALKTLPAPERNAAALRLWVRREAVLKALGCGLAGASRIALSVDTAAHILEIDGAPPSPRWTLRDLDLGCRLAGAVCAAAANPVIAVRRFGLDAISAGLAASAEEMSGIWRLRFPRAASLRVPIETP